MTLSICQTAPRSRSPGILLEFDGIHRSLVWISRVSTIALSRAKRNTHIRREDDEKLSRHSSDALGLTSRGAAAAARSRTLPILTWAYARHMLIRRMKRAAYEAPPKS